MTEQADKQVQSQMQQGPPGSSDADSALPEIRPPAAGFILQLFLIPMLIVSVIICVYLLFSFISRSESPTELVRGLKKMNNASWQKAYTLSSMLRDSTSSELKNDKELARELIAILQTELPEEAADDNQIKLRLFVCKCLGEFEIDTGLPVLLHLARQSDNENELVIALTAVESLSVLIQNLGAASLEDHQQLLETLLLVSNRQAENPDHIMKFNQIRSAAGYALGVLGSDAAQICLEAMLQDAHPNTRFNAAVGLARHGNLSSMAVLEEMLDPQNDAIVEGEPVGSHGFKRSVVIINAIRAVNELAKFHSPEELSELLLAMKKLNSSEKIDAETRLLARDAVLKITTK